MSGIVKGKKKREIILVRHGETVMNNEKTVRGWTSVPLTEDSKEELHELGKILSDKVEGIFSCNLLRTLQTSLCLSKGGNIPLLKTYDFLRTWNVGGFTGMPTETADTLLESLARDEPDKEIEGGESFNAFKARYLLGLIATLNRYEGTFAFVTHGRNLATLNAWAFADFNEELKVDTDYLSYEAYPPVTAHIFTIDTPLLK